MSALVMYQLPNPSQRHYDTKIGHFGNIPLPRSPRSYVPIIRDKFTTILDPLTSLNPSPNLEIM